MVNRSKLVLCSEPVSATGSTQREFKELPKAFAVHLYRCQTKRLALPNGECGGMQGGQSPPAILKFLLNFFQKVKMVL